MVAPSLLAAVLVVQSAPSLPVLTLEQALREARQKNLDIQQAEARLRQAQQLSSKAWSYYLPQISAQGGYTYNEPSVVLPAGSFGAGSARPWPTASSSSTRRPRRSGSRRRS